MLQAVSNMAPQALYRVPTPPGKSWNCVCKISRTWKVQVNEFCPGKSWNCICKISRTWKVLENEIGPGKSWNLLGSDAGAMMQTQTPKLFLCYFFATCDNDEHILQYGCCYHTIYIWLVTAVCLYLNIAGLRQSPGKMLLGSWKSHGTFVTRRVGTLRVYANMTSTAGLTVSPHTHTRMLKLGTSDFCTVVLASGWQPLNWAWSRSRDPFVNFGSRHMFVVSEAGHFKFGDGDLVIYYYFASAAVDVDSSHMTASSSVLWSRYSPPSKFVNGHVSTMWFIWWFCDISLCIDVINIMFSSCLCGHVGFSDKSSLFIGKAG